MEAGGGLGRSARGRGFAVLEAAGMETGRDDPDCGNSNEDASGIGLVS
jgi:hypothetical protein